MPYCLKWWGNCDRLYSNLSIVTKEYFMVQQWYSFSCYDRNSSFQGFANITFAFSWVFMFHFSISFFVNFQNIYIVTDDKPKNLLSSSIVPLLYLNEFVSLLICNDRSPSFSIYESYGGVAQASSFYPILTSSHLSLNRLHS